MQSYFKEPAAFRVSVREKKSGYFCQDARICSTPTLAPLQTLQPCKPLANVKSLNETTALCLYKLIKLESENKVFMQKPKNTMSI